MDATYPIPMWMANENDLPDRERTVQFTDETFVFLSTEIWKLNGKRKHKLSNIQNFISFSFHLKMH